MSGPTRPGDRAGDVFALLAGLVPGSVAVWAQVLPDGVSAAEAAGLVLGAVALGAVFRRRRWPVGFGLLTVVVGAVTPLAGFLPLVGVYTVGVLRRWPATVAVALVASAVSVATLLTTAPDLRFSLDPTAPLLTALVASVLLTVLAAVGGMFVGARRELLASLRERAERAEAEQALRAEQARTAERRRIAREMHDALGHRLSLLSVHAGALELRDDLPPATVARTAGILSATARAALDDLREVVLVLREPAGDDGPQPRLTDVDALVAQSREAGATVELTPALPDTPPDQLGRTAYRVAQEGLTNARRHAAGTPVRVELAGRPGGDLTVRVTSGPALGPPDRGGAGTGLIGLRERVALAGGVLEAGPDGAGRHVLTARMPWPVPGG